jgi:polysaccharide chain length determinant protein (PEP-CTERM system associated)
MWSRRKLLAILVCAGSLAGAMTIAVSLPSIYRSGATVLVERQQVSETFVRPSVTGELDTRLQTISQEILSRARLDALIDRFGLYPELRRQASREAAIERARRDIQVELKGVEQTWGRGPTIAFTVSFRGRDPDTVARVANALASFYVEQNLKIRERQATDTAQFLDVQLQETQRRLDEEERRISEFKRRHLGELPEQVAVNLATLERLNTQLALNNNNQMRAVERRAALARQLAGGEPLRAGDEDIPAARLARLRLELAQMQRLYSEKYPDVIRLKAEIAAAEEQFAEAGPSAPAEPAVPGLQKPVGELDAEINALKTEEQRLRRAIAAYQRRVEAAPEREQEFQEMSRDYRTTKERYDSMLKRYQDAQVAQDMERRQSGEEFRLLDPAIPARGPSAPNRNRLVLLGALFSIGAAAAAVVLAERLDTSFHTVDDLRAFTKIPVLVTIPRIVSAADANRRRRRLGLAAVSIPLGLALVVLASYYVAHGNEQLVSMLSRGAS